MFKLGFGPLGLCYRKPYGATLSYWCLSLFFWWLLYLLHLAFLNSQHLAWRIWPSFSQDLLKLNLQIFVAYSLVPLLWRLILELKKPFKQRQKVLTLLLNYWQEKAYLIPGLLFFVLEFFLICAITANLKPNIPLLNPRNFDEWLIYWDESLFGPWWIYLNQFKLTWPGLFFPLLYFLEFIYDLFGNYFTLIFSILLHRKLFKTAQDFLNLLGCGLILTLWISAFFPSQGPFFHLGQYFLYLDQLPTEAFQFFLRERYFALLSARENYEIWIINGLGAMPSYHVFSWCLSSFFFGKIFGKKAWILAGLALSLNFCSTLILGWHYILDGLVAILLCFGVLGLYAKIRTDYDRF